MLACISIFFTLVGMAIFTFNPTLENAMLSNSDLVLICLFMSCLFGISSQIEAGFNELKKIIKNDKESDHCGTCGGRLK